MTANNNKVAGAGTDGPRADALITVLGRHQQQLIDLLEQGDMNGAGALISELYESRDQILYKEVGRLTRALHNSLRDFHLDIGLQSHSDVKNELSEMADARSRLDYVIELTEEAANTTMDRVDECLPLAQRLSNEAQSLEEALRAQPNDGEQALDGRVAGLLQATQQDSGRLQTLLNEIMVAQGFQDLSGQVIKRVIALVNDVEQSLVKLVRLASAVEAAAGIRPSTADAARAAIIDPDADAARKIRAEGPLMKKAGNTDVVSGQDDVDDLLSSLGF